MTTFRTDARRVCDERRERASATPARFAVPAVVAVSVVALVAALLHLFGASTSTVGWAALVTVLLACFVCRRTITSLIAGATLLFVRPYLPGERVRLYSTEVGANVVGEIVRVGLINTTLAMPSGPLVVANTRLLRAAPEQLTER